MVSSDYDNLSFDLFSHCNVLLEKRPLLGMRLIRYAFPHLKEYIIGSVDRIATTFF